MRHKNDPQIYPPALCVAGCGLPWEKWCRPCNLVYCTNHADPAFHKCRTVEEPVKESSKDIPLVVPIKPRGRKRKNVPSAEDKQTELPLEHPPETKE